MMEYMIEALNEGTPRALVGARGECLLTTRENEIVVLIAEGLSNRAAARQLLVSENAIKKALLRIFEKLGISNRVELVLYALAQRNNSNRNTHRHDCYPAAPRKQQSLAGGGNGM
jgi:DNA-binding NarL/FixJ family response regulator